jgi:uncharacterized protein YukE
MLSADDSGLAAGIAKGMTIAEGVPSPPMLAAKRIQGLRLPLDLRTPLAYLDLDGDFVIRVEGLPMDCTLSKGRQDDGMNWLLERAEIDGLEILLPASFNDQVPFGVCIESRQPGLGGVPEVLSRFDLMLTAEGARSAFSHLEPEDKDSDKIAMRRMRKSVSKGRGKLAPKTVKRALTFGDKAATEEFVAHRSTSYLDALFQGDLSQKQGEPMEVTMGVEQRIALAKSLWEGESKERMTQAQRRWEQENKSLRTRIAELEEQLRQALERDD